MAHAGKLFTNWLTSPTKIPKDKTDARIDGMMTGGSVLPAINLETLSSCINCSPDVIVEIGNTRFMAHGIVLSAHSGYLRSAIRMDDRGAFNSTNNTVLYLSNVTHEQFAPLLTYMYTGYLDLNVDNILGILLATHVLHMPRALEICRVFLSHAQTEGYFLANNNDMLSDPGTTTADRHKKSNTKIIRPIASKPSITNLGFIPISPMHHQLRPQVLLPEAAHSRIIEAANNDPMEQLTLYTDEENDIDEDIDVDKVERQSLNNKNFKILTDEEDEEEVFIDSNSEPDTIAEVDAQELNLQKPLVNSLKEQQHLTKKGKKVSTAGKDGNNKIDRRQLHHNNATKSSSSSALQIAKAPIPMSQLNPSEADKVIIDVASCDGPVRFKRILNTAYGQTSNSSGCASSMARIQPKQERSQQSLSLSFHQQMAKTISQHRQHLQHTAEMENSKVPSGSCGNVSSLNRPKSSDTYICVYCKHTFKSQYCYQKHAKRHLNPLYLPNSCSATSKQTDEPTINTDSGGTVAAIMPSCAYNKRPQQSRQSSIKHLQSTHLSSASIEENTTAEHTKRDMKPLDMNVQYFPCKTCGCKFPSYYFVHKHRKMCHVAEETQITASSSNLNMNSSTTSTPKPDN